MTMWRKRLRQSRRFIANLKIGKAPDKDAYTIKSQDEYYNKVSELPSIISF